MSSLWKPEETESVSGQGSFRRRSSDEEKVNEGHTEVTEEVNIIEMFYLTFLFHNRTRALSPALE